MDSNKPYISHIEFLTPSAGLHVFVTGLCFAIHGIVMYYLISTMGEPYKNVVAELAEEAARNGTVLTLESLVSTDELPIPGEFAPHPLSVVALIVSIGLHLLYYLVQRWSVYFRVFLQYRKEKYPSKFACVYPPLYRGKAEVVSLVRNEESALGENLYLFTFQRRKFTVSKTGQVSLLSFPLDVVVADFIDANVGGIVSAAEVKKRESLYGLNRVDIPIPPFWKLFLEQLLSPIPIFQLFCSALWMMDEYWKYTIFTLMSIFGFEVSTTVQRKKSLETLKSMGGKTLVNISVFRAGIWTTLSSDHLLPGDRCRWIVGASSVPCDCLIVKGSAVVNEASLTGESIPQMKDAIDADRKEILDITVRDKVHCLFSGTLLIRGDPDLEFLVLRTGSESSQGELLRMVEFSQEAMHTDKRDTMYLLLLLLGFAILAAGYIVYERINGTGGENLSKMTIHKLTLRIIMIITSVVPPELPMQMSLSVNTALMALHRLGIFCTEPFRVPMAGTVTHCFFDKTGTLTSDQLVCVGLSSTEHPTLVKPMVNMETIIAGCHSLIEVDGKLIGDPIEVTALEKIEWKWSPKTNTCVCTKNSSTVTILHRFHFSSALQRMSCVVSVSSGGYYSLVKGSPEMILTALAPSVKTAEFVAWYTKKYESLAQSGLRVLALAWKSLPTPKDIVREFAESKLQFAGFVSFACETRADSKIVINALSVSADLRCVMVTGDALLTAVHVAKETGISTRPVLQLVKRGGSQFAWESLDGSNKRIFALADCLDSFDLAVVGDVLDDPGVWELVVPHVVVFARMSPSQKERVIGTIRELGGQTLMCGDGGNDVGALKQADVGVALLAGFGATNTSTATPLFEDPEEALEKEGKLLAMKQKILNGKIGSEFALKKKELMAKQQEWMMEELARNGNSYWLAIKTVTAKLREELAKEGKIIQAKHGSAWSNAVVGGAAAASTNTPTVQMGDASVAAPFTSRSPSIRCVVEIIRQGRCTLLVAVQMMQIMMLESLISAYTFAAITMEGGRSTEIQLIGSSLFVMVASIAFTYAKPAKKLSKVVPLKSVFHPSIFVSVVFQVAIHLLVLVYAMSWAKEEMGPEALSDLYEFERVRERKLGQLMTDKDQDDAGGWFSGITGGQELLAMFKSVPYQPNLLNTVMFLVKTSQQVSVLVVNYKGSPWMQGAIENKALFLSMFMCAIGILVCAIGYFPIVNETMELLVLPPDLRTNLLVLLSASTFGTLVVDRLIVLVFSRKIFMASTWNPLMSLRLADFYPILQTCGYIVGALAVAPIVLGNPIGLIGGIYAYKQYRKWMSDKEVAELQKYEATKIGASPQ